MSQRGRKRHEPTDQQRKMVEALAGFGIPQERICEVLELSLPTLHRAYRAELSRGAARVEANLILNLLRIANGSDGTALKAITFALQMRFGWSQFNSQRPDPKGPVLGKKEMANMEAETALEGTTWRDLVH